MSWIFIRNAAITRERRRVSWRSSIRKTGRRWDHTGASQCSDNGGCTRYSEAGASAIYRCVSLSVRCKPARRASSHDRQRHAACNERALSISSRRIARSCERRIPSRRPDNIRLCLCARCRRRILACLHGSHVVKIVRKRHARAVDRDSKDH